MLLKDLGILAGPDMDFIRKGFLEIKDGRISRVGEGSNSSSNGVIDCEGLIAIPGFVNAHTHVGDSIAKDVGVGLPIADVVSPHHGLKHQILRSTPDAELVAAMHESLRDMISSGITTFADFREDGLHGVQLLLEAAKDLPIRPVMLGRLSKIPFTSSDLDENVSPLPDHVLKEAKEVLLHAQGISASSANDLTDPALQQLSGLAHASNKLRAIHVAEAVESIEKSKKRTGMTDVERVVKHFDPSFVVHMTNASDDDISLVAENRVPIVSCPRANSTLGVGFPPIMRMADAGLTIALGTDNVMVNPPNMFREMDYVGRLVRAIERDPRYPKPLDVLRMATINGARALGMEREIGTIEVGKSADLVLVDCTDLNLRHSRDPVASLVLRADAQNVRAVIIKGKLAYER